ncbi:hypothetical protein SUGI_0469320 [Cryptomeria japonica]|nr:hypothetical protein SUGI_0469320 [Cryptomeria japonica]
MYMIASKELKRGCDVTPQIPPLSWALSDSLLSFRCSACFSKLNVSYPCTAQCGGSVIYCSQQCRDADIDTHLRSGECHLLSNVHGLPPTSTSDLRAALRLLFHQRPSPSSSNPRIGDLITNHEYLVGRKRRKSSASSNGHDSDCQEIAQEIEEGARLMHLARTHVGGAMECDGDVQRVEEEALCAVITNGVEVQVDQFQETSTRGSEMQSLVLGTAVYGPLFSWCNHSCRPNACYRFVLNTGRTSCDSQFQKTMVSGNSVFIEPGNKEFNIVSLEKEPGIKIHGPRVVLRTIRSVSRGEEIFITYTDLMQPKETRQEELWLKYRFVCHCERCDLPMTSYMDRSLQEINNISMIQPSCESDCSKTKSVKTLMDEIKCGIEEFISNSDADSFCGTLEHVLGKIVVPKGSVMNLNQLQSGKSVFLIHPLHHLCLSAYTALASAYRIRANGALHFSLNKCDLASNGFDFPKSVFVCTAAMTTESVSREHDHDVHGYSPANSFVKRYHINTCPQECSISGSTDLLHSHIVAKKEICNCQYATTMEDSELIKASDSSRAVAAYTLLHAGVVHHFFLAGEQGLIMTAARFWMTAGEALLSWILGCGFQASISEMNCHSVRNWLHLMFGPLSQRTECSCFLLNYSIGVMWLHLHSKCGCHFGELLEEDLGSVDGYPRLLRVSEFFLRCMNKFVKLLWPLLQSGLPFLEAILNPVDYSWLPDSEKQHLLRQTFVQDKVERKNDEKEDSCICIDLKECDFNKNSSLEISERLCLSEKDSASYCSCMKKEDFFAIYCAVHCICYSKYLLEEIDEMDGARVVLEVVQWDRELARAEIVVDCDEHDGYGI